MHVRFQVMHLPSDARPPNHTARGARPPNLGTYHSALGKAISLFTVLLDIALGGYIGYIATAVTNMCGPRHVFPPGVCGSGDAFLQGLHLISASCR